MTHPFTAILEARSVVVLDGGLATALERRGRVLDTDLWSAVALRDDPDAIAGVHRAFLDAGADCITTASYQASLPGFAEAGIDEGDAVELIHRSSRLALAVRDERAASLPATAPTPLVAASVGPYGAYLADGSEYNGLYGVTSAGLDRFHRRRFALLASSGVDLLACETIPSAQEGDVLLGILDDQPPDVRAWMSFACRDGERLCDGTPIEEVVARCSGHDRITAVGVNCTAPEHVPELIARARSVTDGLLVAYPNSGERYDPASGTWSDPLGAAAGRPDGVETPDASTGPRAQQDARVANESWLEGVLAACDAGARIVGGCCRVTPAGIARLRRALDDREHRAVAADPGAPRLTDP